MDVLAGFIVIILYLVYLVISIIMIVKFFQLCEDTKEIKELLKTGILKGGIRNEAYDAEQTNVIESKLNTIVGLPTNPGQCMIIGSFGICTFVDEAPKGTFNFKTEKGQNISMKATDVLNLGKLVI